MPIPTSGALSLSGTIQAEFGGTNPTSISEYYAGGSFVPAGTTGTNGAVPSSGQISFSQFYGTQKGFEYWLTVYRGTIGSTTHIYGIGLDSSGNVYTGGGWSNFTNSHVMKMDSGGNRQWTKRLALSSGSFVQINALRTTSSGDVVAVGTYDSTSSKGFIARWNSSGTLQWIRYITSSSTTLLTSVDIASGGSIYVSGTDNTTGYPGLVVMKFNSSGTLQWQRYVTGDGSQTTRTSISIDSSENVYVSQISRNGTDAGANWNYILRYNSSGTLQWQRALQASGQFYSDSPIYSDVDSSGNLLIVNAKFNSSSNYFPSLNKVSSTGTLTWTREWTSGGFLNDPNGLVCNGTDVFINQTFSDGSNFRAGVTKYNGSGVFQFRKISSLYGTSSNSRDIQTNGSYLYFGSTSTSATTSAGISKIDMNANLSNFTNVTGVTNQTGTSSIFTGGLTDSSGSLSVATSGSLVDDSVTPTSYVITQLT